MPLARLRPLASRPTHEAAGRSDALDQAGLRQNAQDRTVAYGLRSACALTALSQQSANKPRALTLQTLSMDVVVEVFLAFTGKVLVFLLSLGAWTLESMMSNESSIYAAAGA